MRELNPVGRELDNLLLVSSDGEKFSVLIDETLTKTIKEHRVPDSRAADLSPREIQDAIRSGITVAELAESSGGSFDLIERFAHPVLEELSHMVDLAKSIRVELPADRFNDVEKRPFGEIVEGKLLQSGAKVTRWSAKRGENSVWEISVHFEQNRSIANATWTFDPRRYLLTPETSNAASLSTPTLNLDSPLGGFAKPAVNAEPDASVVTADKLEAFRKRREQATSEVEVVELVAETTEVDPEIVLVEEEVAFDLIEESEAEFVDEGSQEAPEEISTPATETKKSRPPMPSWDQIVRGTQSDDGEAF